MGVDPISLAFLAVATVATGGSLYESSQANKQAKVANQAQQQQNSLQNARQQRDTIRQARMAQANAQSAAENQGVGSSSAAAGGTGSIVSQMNDTLSFLDQYGTLSDQASRALGKEAAARNNANTFNAVSDLAVAGYSNAPKISETVKKVFGGG